MQDNFVYMGMAEASMSQFLMLSADLLGHHLALQ